MRRPGSGALMADLRRMLGNISSAANNLDRNPRFT
jgi:hypothetical protein